MTSTALLNATSVGRRRAGRWVVRDVSLSLNRGEVLGLLGVNGAGKSTTLGIFSGALRPDEGTLELDGHDFLAHPEQARRLIGWLPENAPAWPELSVEEHLRAFARLRGASARDAATATMVVMERLALGGMRRRLAGVLSQGQRQRLGLACALVHRPALLILDEPANALDPVQVSELHALIRERAADGSAVILSTHVLAEVVAVCDRAVVMHEGQLRHDGPVTGADGARALEDTFFAIATGSAR